LVYQGGIYPFYGPRQRAVAACLDARAPGREFFQEESFDGQFNAGGIRRVPEA
jgi:hypothetical protein